MNLVKDKWDINDIIISNTDVSKKMYYEVTVYITVYDDTYHIPSTLSQI